MESQTVCWSDYSPWILNGLKVAFLTAVDISDDEDGMAVDIFFKPRVEAMEQMAQNYMAATWTFRKPRIKESEKSRPSDMYNRCM